jgi:hypothetical protein
MKDFEGSYTRVIVIMAITYGKLVALKTQTGDLEHSHVIAFCNAGTLYGYMKLLGVNNPVSKSLSLSPDRSTRYYKSLLQLYAQELNAIVPAIGFNLSTWSLPWVRIIWFRTRNALGIKSAEHQPWQIMNVRHIFRKVGRKADTV